jgi:hypothetical protein
VEFSSLPVSAFSISKSLSGANKLFITTGRGLEFVSSVSYCSTHLQSFCLFRHLFCSVCEAPTCPDSMLLGWRLALISLYVAAYMWNKPVNNTYPTRNFQRVRLSASALSASCFHLAPFPFTLGEFWTRCPYLNYRSSH